MISAKRIPGRAPSSLDKAYRDGTTELERAKKHYLDEEKTTSFKFNRYSSADVKDLLNEIFHGKCAYCESFYAKTQPVDVEHYRPKAKIDGETDHLGYWWLAMEWTNLLPSCIDCNRKRFQKTPQPDSSDTMVSLNRRGDFTRGKEIKTGKQSAFPLQSGSARASWNKATENTDISAEKCLLLDPTTDSPSEHLVFHVERSTPDNMISIVYPMPLDPDGDLHLPGTDDDLTTVAADATDHHVSEVGAVSIQVYGLNRLSLVQARTKMLRDLEFLLEMSISLTSLRVEIDDRTKGLPQRIANASDDAKSQLEADLALNERVSKRLAEMADDTIKQIKAMTEPQAQFSALANAWVEKFLQ